MKKIFKKQNFLITIVVFTILLFGLGIVKADVNSQLVSIQGDISEVGRETLEILLALKSLKLDDSLFDELSFKNLKDFSIELEEKEIGKENPFEEFILIDENE